uniref:Queuosine 5'-phosphate N-glycosylase/hydrolase n=1 Tax=Anolis carolinensis TaxID=28377 RepID=A0A803SWQ7_ANOCA
NLLQRLLEPFRTEGLKLLLDSFFLSFLYFPHTPSPFYSFFSPCFPPYTFPPLLSFLSLKVAFYKRTQILVADIWSVLEGKGDGCFSDISSVTIFADYRLPQVLVHLGSGDKLEVEIRGCSIWCCELICKRLLDLYKKKGKDIRDKINPVLLDYYLWDYARDHREDMAGIPFHRVRCIYY